jgi:hypothetical protein
MAQARKVAEAITDDGERTKVLAEVAEALAAAGDLRAAASLIGAVWLMHGHPFRSWHCLVSVDPNAALSLIRHLTQNRG